MKTLFLQVGKTHDKRIASLVSEYVARINHYQPFETEEIPDIKKSGRTSDPLRQKEEEGFAILRRLKEGDYLILLDERGKELRSVELASFLQKRTAAGWRRLVFVVGGPFGFSQEVYGRAQEMISLSKLTFPHQLIRLFFAEQFYRAMTILRSEPYHHE